MHTNQIVWSSVKTLPKLESGANTDFFITITFANQKEIQDEISKKFKTFCDECSNHSNGTALEQIWSGRRMVPLKRETAFFASTKRCMAQGIKNPRRNAQGRIIQVYIVPCPN